MKALILAGGKGSRLRPITYSIAKQLVPVANKPVIEFGINAIRGAGIKDFGIIVGDAEAEIRAALGDGSRFGASFTYIRQEAPLGLAHAVKTAQPYLRDERFIVYLGDNLLRSGVCDFVEEFEKNECDALILLAEVTNPQDFGVAELEGKRVVRLQEKPKEPKSNFALVGVYLFTQSVFDAIDTLKPSFRGEYEITDAIQTLIDWHKDVRCHIVTGWWKDTGTVEAMLEANRLILEDMEHCILGQVEDSGVEGPLSLGTGSRIINSTIRGPVIIGRNCLIENSYIGPYSSIADNTKLLHSEIEYSIVMDGCTISKIEGRIYRSLIGRGVDVSKAMTKPKSVQLVLGDHSSVILP